MESERADGGGARRREGASLSHFGNVGRGSKCEVGPARGERGKGRRRTAIADTLRERWRLAAGLEATRTGSAAAMWHMGQGGTLRLEGSRQAEKVGRTERAPETECRGVTRACPGALSPALSLEGSWMCGMNCPHTASGAHRASTSSPVPALLPPAQRGVRPGAVRPRRGGGRAPHGRVREQPCFRSASRARALRYEASESAASGTCARLRRALGPKREKAGRRRTVRQDTAFSASRLACAMHALQAHTHCIHNIQRTGVPTCAVWSLFLRKGGQSKSATADARPLSRERAALRAGLARGRAEAAARETAPSFSLWSSPGLR